MKHARIAVALAGALLSGSLAAGSLPWLVGSRGAGGGIGGDALIWELDATASDNITTANTKGPAVTVTRAGAGKTRITSTGTFENLSANTLLRDHIGNGTEFMVAGFQIETAHTNLVLQSEDLNTTWASVGTPTFSANSTTLGSANLDLLGDDSAAAVESKTQTITFTGNAVKVCSVVIKSFTAASSVIELRDTTAAADRLQAAITWSGGLPVATMGTGTFEGYDKLASSAFRLRFTTTSVTAANVNVLRLSPASDNAELVTLTGATEFGAMQCENDTFSHSYTPTTTATVTAAADVVDVAISGIPNFNAATGTIYARGIWGADTIGGVFGLNDGTPNERTEIARLTTTNVEGIVADGGVSQAQGNMTTTAVAAVFFKAAIAFAANDTGFAYDGVAGAADVSCTMPAPTTVNIGRTQGGGTMNGHVANAALFNRRLIASEIAALTEPDPVWEWDAGQLSMTPIKGVGTPVVTRATSSATRVNALGFIETVAQHLPRFDYSPTSVGVLRGLLVEETRTNLLLRSAEIDNASWTKANTSITPNAVASPDGGTNADLITNTAANGSTRQTATIVADATVTLSGFFRRGVEDFGLLQVDDNAGGGAQDGFRAWFNLNTGTIGTTQVIGGNGATFVSASMTSYGNGWYRCSITGTIETGQTTSRNFVAPATANGSAATADGATIYVWGAQLEQGAFPTSYIPTTAATVARNADVITLATANIPGFSATTLTVFAEAYGAPATAVVAAVSDGTTSEFHRLLSISGSGARYEVRDGAVNQAQITLAAWVAGVLGKLAGASAVNDFPASFNGGAVSTDTSGTLPTVPTLEIGSNSAASYWNAPIRNLRIYNYRAPDARLQRLTTSWLLPAANDPLYVVQMVA